MVSLGIHIDDVIKVLLPDGWHDVREHSFDVAAYDYMLLPPDTRVSFDKEDLITEYGFTFTDSEDGRRKVAGPVTSIMAVKMIHRHHEAGR
jgi:hypothetical protein